MCLFYCPLNSFVSSLSSSF